MKLLAEGDSSALFLGAAGLVGRFNVTVALSAFGCKGDRGVGRPNCAPLVGSGCKGVCNARIPWAGIRVGRWRRWVRCNRSQVRGLPPVILSGSVVHKVSRTWCS